MNEESKQEIIKNLEYAINESNKTLFSLRAANQILNDEFNKCVISQNMTDFEKYKKLFIDTNVSFTEKRNKIIVSALSKNDKDINCGDSWSSFDLDFDDSGKLICLSMFG